MPRINVCHRALNKPLTIMGCERGLFFFTLTVTAGVWISFETIVGAVIFFVAALQTAKWVTRTDPQMLRIIINSSKQRSIYDPGKRVVCNVQIIH